MSEHEIILATLNAKYIHSSLGLRYLYANLNELQSRASIREFTIHKRAEEIAESLLAKSPKILALGVYIWNIEETTKLVAILKQIQPELIIVLGGPEVSYEQDQQAICHHADYVISGQGDIAFASLCRKLLTPSSNDSTLPDKYICADQPDLKQLTLPYRFYTDEDLAHRIIYVEASRGCPFKCEFCLSALDKTAYPFELDAFLEEMRLLFQRGARHFKFVDRTFNLKVENSKKILEFFLDLSQHSDIFLHFELIPDNLPEPLRESIARFKPGALQFEIGIQSLNDEVQALISRKQNLQKITDNISWLKTHSHAHLHTDLIVGLPASDLDSIAHDFDTLIRWQVHEIQVGILKRLRGTPIIRHCQSFQLRFNPAAPYTILCSDRLSYLHIQRLTRFARYWDMIGNSGRFARSRELILGTAPFSNFMRLADSLFQRCGETHKIALKRLFELIHRILIEDFAYPEQQVSATLRADFEAGGFRKGAPDFITATSGGKSAPSAATSSPQPAFSANKRQRQHAKSAE